MDRLSLVYAIAKKDFSANTWLKMQEIFGYMHENDVNYKNWQEMACWGDDLKGAGWGQLDGWHFYNEPFCDGISREKVTVVVNRDYCVVDTVVRNDARVIGRCSKSAKAIFSAEVSPFVYAPLLHSSCG